jgi:hypothetical protein
MKLVAQEDEFGCGVASVASLLNLSYQDALKLFNPEFAGIRGYFCVDLVEALYQYGHCYCWGGIEALGSEKLQKLASIPGNIVFVDNSGGYPFGHYTTNTPNGWMNSWANFPQAPPTASFERDLSGNLIYVVYNLNKI